MAYSFGYSWVYLLLDSALSVCDSVTFSYLSIRTRWRLWASGLVSRSFYVSENGHFIEGDIPRQSGASLIIRGFSDCWGFAQSVATQSADGPHERGWNLSRVLWLMIYGALFLGWEASNTWGCYGL